MLHLVALRAMPAVPRPGRIAASLAVTALLAVRVFRDRLSRSDWAAIVAVCVGLVLLTAAAGETGEERATGRLSVALFAVAGAMVLGGLVATRARGAVAPACSACWPGWASPAPLSAAR